MLKNAYDVSPQTVSEEVLLEAAVRFLHRIIGDGILLPVENLASSDLGASDLAFVRQDRSWLTVAKLHRRGDFETFALQAAAYHLWLKECTRISQTILNRTIGLDTYLISYNLPSADSFLLKAISGISGLSFIRYQLLDIEDWDEPVVRFKLIDVEACAKDRPEREKNDNTANQQDVRSLPVPGLSPLEIDAFNRLKAQHL